MTVLFFASGPKGIWLQVNFLTEISRNPPLAALAFRFAQTRALLRASNPPL